MKLFDAELKLMELVWENAPISAKDLSIQAANTIGWNKNTTYTVLKKLVAKKAVLRNEPNFICTPLISRETVQKSETRNLIDKLYNGSVDSFLATFIQNENLTEEDIKALLKLLDK